MAKAYGYLGKKKEAYKLDQVNLTFNLFWECCNIFQENVSIMSASKTESFYNPRKIIYFYYFAQRDRKLE